MGIRVDYDVYYCADRLHEYALYLAEYMYERTKGWFSEDDPEDIMRIVSDIQREAEKMCKYIHVDNDKTNNSLH